MFCSLCTENTAKQAVRENTTVKTTNCLEQKEGEKDSCIRKRNNLKEQNQYATKEAKQSIMQIQKFSV